MKRIDLDHAATTPLLPEALAAMQPWLTEEYGNPSSIHAVGRRAKDGIDEARAAFAEAFGCLFGEITFCSSATEAAMLSLVGLALSAPDDRRRVLVSRAEHSCVIGATWWLTRLGLKVEWVDVCADSSVDLGDLESKIGTDCLAVVAMSINNETGILNPVHEICGLCQAFGARFVCDVVQSFPTNVDFGWDVAFCAPHKFGGPKGIGVVAARYPAVLEPVIRGGGQEREMRAGTENVAAIMGAAEALKVARRDAEKWAQNQRLASQAFLGVLRIGAKTIMRDEDKPSILNLCFAPHASESILIRLDRAGVNASAGAACSSGSLEPSQVLLACGFSEEQVRSCVRFSFGRDTTIEEAVKAAEIVNQVVRSMS